MAFAVVYGLATSGARGRALAGQRARGIQSDVHTSGRQPLCAESTPRRRGISAQFTYTFMRLR